MIYDVAVVGAGPAGATAARQAALKGLSVVLIEKQSIPRMKPCAGLVSKKALNELDFNLPERITAEEIKGVKLVDNEFREFTEKTPRIIGKTVKRSKFDAFLTRKAEEAGALILDGTGFKKIKEDKDQIRITTTEGEVVSRFLVGTDGVYSKVARQSGIRKKWNKWELGFTLYTDIPCNGSEKNIDPELAELFCVSFPFSLGWLFHHGDYLNIGIGTSKLVDKKLFPIFYSWLDKLAEHKNIDITRHKIQGYYLPAGGFKRPITRGRVFLAGDAAGFVDSFSGEGIYFAIRSARYLVEEISQGLSRGRIEDIGARYTDMCYRDFLKEFRLSLATAVILGKKVTASQFVRYNPSLVRHLANIMENKGGFEIMLKEILLKLPGMINKYTRGQLGLKSNL